MKMRTVLQDLRSLKWTQPNREVEGDVSEKSCTILTEDRDKIKDMDAR